MSEFESWQSLLMLRRELITVLLSLCVVNFAFIVLAIWQRHGLEKMHSNWLKMLCLSISVLLIWHGLDIASQMLSTQSVDVPGMQSVFTWITLLLSAVIAVLGPWISNYFLDRTVKPYST